VSGGRCDHERFGNERTEIPSIIDSKNGGRIVKKGDPDYDKVRIDNLEDTVRELTTAWPSAERS
jgi:hypothetical protein